MKIKLIIFDLDGVLVDSKEIHYESLNLALGELSSSYIITREEHLNIYNGLSTNSKLKILTKNKNLPIELYEKIWNRKQEYTLKLVDKYLPDERIINILSKLKEMNYTIYIASNSIWNTIKIILLRKGFLEYIDYFISNQEVKNPKPSPEIYLQSVIRSEFSINETLIIEDSPIGLKSAIDSGCHVLKVDDSSQVTLDIILNKINELSKD